MKLAFPFLFIIFKGHSEREYVYRILNRKVCIESIRDCINDHSKSIGNTYRRLKERGAIEFSQLNLVIRRSSE